MFALQFKQKMFSVSKKSESGFDIVILKDEKSGAYAEIVPQCGAALHGYGIQNNTSRVEVIDHFGSMEEFSNSVEQMGFRGCKLSPFVCRMRYGRYTFNNQPYQISSLKGGQHALHGLLYKKRFLVIKQSAGQNAAEVALKYSYNKEDAGYPFSYDCTVTYTLSGHSRLNIKTECVNTSEQAIPLQDGWHPYFNLGKKIDDLELEFQSKEQYVFDHEILPTGKTVPFTGYQKPKRIGQAQIDNSYLLDFQQSGPLCVLRNKEEGLELRILPGVSYPILQIYTPPHRNSVAIENLSGPPNAFNLGKGFIPLPAGQSTAFETAYQINLI